MCYHSTPWAVTPLRPNTPRAFFFNSAYLGPFDQYVSDASARNPFPKVPPPDKCDIDLLGGGSVELPKEKKREGGHQFMKRQNPPLPGCTALNECSVSKRKSPFCTKSSPLISISIQRDAQDRVHSTTRAEGDARVRVDI